MPIYEYECAKCLHHFDLMQKINDQPIKQCPECQENKVIRLVSAAGLELKGSGWYVTDLKIKILVLKKKRMLKRVRVPRRIQVRKKRKVEKIVTLKIMLLTKVKRIET